LLREKGCKNIYTAEAVTDTKDLKVDQPGSRVRKSAWVTILSDHVYQAETWSTIGRRQSGSRLSRNSFQGSETECVMRVGFFLFFFI
jgi:hypothetical protein